MLSAARRLDEPQTQFVEDLLEDLPLFGGQVASCLLIEQRENLDHLRRRVEVGRRGLARRRIGQVAEMECGCSLADALLSLRARIPGSEIATLCASIERSRRLGSPLADQLRRQSASLRRDQRRAVEEHAARAAPKIQLVVALILVPSVLLMIAAALIANADVLLGGF